jgi:hypothetical protein
MEAPMSEFVELYRGFEIHVQVFPFSGDMVDVWCRIVNPTDPKLSPVTAGVQQVDGGPFSAKIGEKMGMYYGMGLIDSYLREYRGD